MKIFKIHCIYHKEDSCVYVDKNMTTQDKRDFEDCSCNYN